MGTPSFGAASAFPTGYGWYRKQLNIPSNWQGKRLFLDFEGAFQDAEIFLNGTKVGAHLGGYTGFEIEITDAAKPGANLLAVRLNNNWNPRLAPRAGEHQFNAGLYRNVWLVACNPLHVTWYGTFVTTPRVSASEGVVRVRTEVINQGSTTQDCTVRTDIISPSGKVLTSMASKQSIRQGETITFDQTSATIERPQLWSPETPVIYAVRTSILAGGSVVDSYESPLGFRWFEFTADQGFFLNGKHRYLKGVNVHQDHAGWGDAVADSGFFRDVRMMKQAGFDFIRGSHYPHAPAFSKACDQLGMLFWSENNFWGTGGKDDPWASSAYPTNPDEEKDFEASVHASLRDMIRIHRNHPSIIVWSMCNEPFFSAPEVMPKVRRLLRELVDHCHELDPSRPAAIGGAQRGDIDKLGDLAGYNGDGARLYPNPGIANFVSEYGSTMENRPGVFDPGWGDLPLTPGATPREPASWRQAWRSGEALWCGFDHASIAGPIFGGMGMVDYFRLPKRQWYWYREAYRGIAAPAWPTAGEAAALQLTTDTLTLNRADGTEDAHLIVTVLDKNGVPVSTSPAVTLTIEAGPGEFPTGPRITFAPDSDIAIRDGKAAIEFRSYHAGETLIRASSPGLADSILRLRTLGAPAFAQGQTPSAKDRPYVRFSEAPASGTWDKFGLENPTRASSEVPGQTARNSNDGSFLTAWSAAPDDARPWLRIDMERIVSVSKVRLFLPAAGPWRFSIEISLNGETGWKPFVVENAVTIPNQWTNHELSGPPTSGRYLRVTLLEWPKDARAGVGDISISGSTAPLRN